jgi:hypothetical protein
MDGDLLSSRRCRYTFTKYAMCVVGVKDAFVIMHRILFVMWAEVPDGGEVGLVSKHLWTCRGRYYRRNGQYIRKDA